MATTLEPTSGNVRYGNRGPDKWDFIHNGILVRTFEDTYHEFTIDDKKVKIKIINARPLPAWQCPSHPEIDRDYQWSSAWEFLGVGDGGYVLGIYSTHSRKGVYHFWPIHVAKEGCGPARQDLHQFFASRENSTAMLALTRAMKHMVRGSALGGHHVDCQDCWDLFRQLRKTCELP